MRPVVSLTRYSRSPDSLRTALERCDGFAALAPSDRVLIKPNLVYWDEDHPVAPYGVFTTTRLVEDLVILLKDHGCDAITIGEGSVEIKRGVGTRQAFEGLGYTRLAKRYGLTLVDFNADDDRAFPMDDDTSLHIAAAALEQDFFINMPVQKTHGQTKVSLGLKNLKGCLKLRSKQACHHPERSLERCFPHVADHIQPALTIVDGIYALEKGASHFGNASRKDLIVASTDPLGADLVAARTIGYAGEQVEHLAHYAAEHHRSLDLAELRMVGDPLEDHIQPLKWDWSWNDENTAPRVFQKMGITGTALPKYDDSLCSGCSLLVNMSNLLVMSAFTGEPLPSIEILNGKKMQARPGYDKTILLGKCIAKANRDNPNIRQAIPVRGCPPRPQAVIDAFRAAGLNVRESMYWDYLTAQGHKYDGQDAYDPRHFTA